MKKLFLLVCLIAYISTNVNAEEIRWSWDNTKDDNNANSYVQNNEENNNDVKKENEEDEELNNEIRQFIEEKDQKKEINKDLKLGFLLDYAHLTIGGIGSGGYAFFDGKPFYGFGPSIGIIVDTGINYLNPFIRGNVFLNRLVGYTEKDYFQSDEVTVGLSYDDIANDYSDDVSPYYSDDIEISYLSNAYQDEYSDYINDINTRYGKFATEFTVDVGNRFILSRKPNSIGSLSVFLSYGMVGDFVSLYYYRQYAYMGTFTPVGLCGMGNVIGGGIEYVHTFGRFFEMSIGVRYKRYIRQKYKTTVEDNISGYTRDIEEYNPNTHDNNSIEFNFGIGFII